MKMGVRVPSRIEGSGEDNEMELDHGTLGRPKMWTLVSVIEPTALGKDLEYVYKII